LNIDCLPLPKILVIAAGISALITTQMMTGSNDLFKDTSVEYF